VTRLSETLFFDKRRRSKIAYPLATLLILVMVLLYSTPGNYNVMLTATGAGGASGKTAATAISVSKGTRTDRAAK
jgi:hypothetical protein